MRIFFIAFLILFQIQLWGQKKEDSSHLKKPATFTISTKDMTIVSNNLKTSIEQKDEYQIALNFELLGNQYSRAENNPNAEEFYKKSLEIFTKLDLKENIARVGRSLARTQEKQKKYTEAIESYNNAGLNAPSATETRININDKLRLQNLQSPEIQKTYIENNIELNTKIDNQLEIGYNYMQLAELDILQKNDNQAVKNLQKALTYTKKDLYQTLYIKKEIVAILEKKQIDKAIILQNEMVQDAKKQSDITIELHQSQELARLYMKKGDSQKAIPILEEIYQKALENHHTLEVRNALLALSDYYKQIGDYQKSNALLEQYMNQLDTLMYSDKSLVDSKILNVTEDKIDQLNTEKNLQEALVKKRSIFNYLLVAALLGLGIFVFFIIKSLRAIQRKNKQIALQSLRLEMNPHFIFNSLNSVNQFIAQNDERKANQYLTSYSGLMRNVMENSNKDFVKLSDELEQLRQYLALEHLRFEDQFDYQIIVDESIECDATIIPNMLIQPHLENAIWHGLRYKETKGNLLLKIELINQRICVTVEDDGIGYAKSQALKTQHQRKHPSRGSQNMVERIQLLNDLYKTDIYYTVEEKEEGSGTVVKIWM